MTRAAIAEARAFESWQDYQEALKRAIAPLTKEQLQRRTIPGQRTPGEIAEHIVFGRALHLRRTLGEGTDELTPLLRWEADDDPPHTGAEIVNGLDLTWRFITGWLMRGSPTDAIPEDKAVIIQTIWGLLDHDLPHAGELSLLLGAGGMPAVEIQLVGTSHFRQPLLFEGKANSQGAMRVSLRSAAGKPRSRLMEPAIATRRVGLLPVRDHLASASATM